MENFKGIEHRKLETARFQPACPRCVAFVLFGLVLTFQSLSGSLAKRAHPQNPFYAALRLKVVLNMWYDSTDSRWFIGYVVFSGRINSSTAHACSNECMDWSIVQVVRGWYGSYGSIHNNHTADLTANRSPWSSMSIRPPPFPKHNLREGIIKSWEYLLLKAPPEWQFGIPILKKFGQSFWCLMWHVQNSLLRKVSIVRNFCSWTLFFSPFLRLLILLTWPTVGPRF